MRWVTAVKMWNTHKKIYVDSHVYAIPRKGTAEYDDVKYVMVNEKLPAHLHKKAPFPEAALAQLRQQEADAKKRREAVKTAVKPDVKPSNTVTMKARSLSEYSPAELAAYHLAKAEEAKRMSARPAKVQLQEQIDALKKSITNAKNRKSPDTEHIDDLEKMLKARMAAMKNLK